MRGKWAAGIVPRNFTWVLRDKLAVSERPGGYGANHRKVRRMEEIIWLREQGFTKVISLLPSPHNLHAYDELGVAWAHVPFPAHAEVAPILADLYRDLQTWLAEGQRLLLHQEELGDRLMGVVAGYLRWTSMLETGPQAITVVEQLLGRPMGPPGRELVAVAESI